MQAGTKLALGAMAGAALLTLTPLGSTLLDLLVGDPAPDEAPAPVASRLLESDPAPSTEVELSSEAPQRRAAEVPAHAAHPAEPEAAAPAAEPVTGVRMRFVDGSGTPIADVRVALARNPDTGGASDPSGVAEAWLDPSVRNWGGRTQVSYEHPTFAPGELRVNLQPEQLTELGDIVLIPAGGITVRVLDAGGGPVEGAWVECFSDFQMRYRDRQLEEEVIEQTLEEGDSGQVTDASGRLHLEDLPAGKMRVWAGREGHLAGYSELFEVRPESPGDEVVVALGELDPELFIRGQVVDASGAGVPNASVSAEYSSRGSSGSTTFGADEEGRFVLAYSPKAPRKIGATDPQDRLGVASAEGVVGGDDIVLRLSAPSFMVLTPSSEEEGVELQGVRVNAYNADHSDLLVHSGQIQREGATLRIPLPDEAFLLDVYAEGHDRLSVGPFDGLTAPRELSVTLRSLPGVKGLVTAGGEPYEGAQVELYAREKRRSRHNGYPVRVSSHSWASGRSDAEGAFVLTLRNEGEFYLRAEAEGFAPAEQGPWPIDPDRGLAGLSVELTQGGAIEGEAWGAEHVAGRIVGISRGDAHPRTMRTDGEGHYRFERLTPGSWQVELVDEEISPYSSTTSTGSGAFRETDIESNCVVVEGQTTRHDLSLTGAGQTLLTGKLLLDGGAAAGWVARLLPAGDDAPAFFVDVLETTVGDDGGFRIEAPEPGEYRLSLHPPQVQTLLLTERLLLVPGENLWEASFETGGVSFTNTPPADSGPPTLLLVGSNGKTELLMVVGGAVGLVASDGVPVMPCQLRRIDPGSLSGFEDLQRVGTLLLNVELRAGETVEIIVP